MKNVGRIRIFGIVMIALAGVAAWFMVLSPRAAEPEHLGDAEAEAMTQKVTLDKQIEILQRRAVYLEDAVGVAHQIGNRFPWQPDVPTLIEQVEAASQAAGMTPDQVASIVPATPTTEGISPALAGEASQATAAVGGGGDKKEGGDAAAGDGEAAAEKKKDKKEAAGAPAMAIMNVKILAEGTMEQVTSFLTALRNGERVIVIDGVSIREVQQSAATDITQTGPTRYALEVNAHTVLLPQDMPVPEIPIVGNPDGTTGVQGTDGAVTGEDAAGDGAATDATTPSDAPASDAAASPAAE